nr:hypothetical protein HmN_000881400 [Hymenolepis microstoma]
MIYLTYVFYCQLSQIDWNSGIIVGVGKIAFGGAHNSTNLRDGSPDKRAEGKVKMRSCTEQVEARNVLDFDKPGLIRITPISKLRTRNEEPLINVDVGDKVEVDFNSTSAHEEDYFDFAEDEEDDLALGTSS